MVKMMGEVTFYNFVQNEWVFAMCSKKNVKAMQTSRLAQMCSKNLAEEGDVLVDITFKSIETL